MKKNSEGKNIFWFGYKAHFVVGTTSQYILDFLFSSGSLNDGKAAIPLLWGIDERLDLSSLRYQTLDAGYDYEPQNKDGPPSLRVPSFSLIQCNTNVFRFGKE